MRLTKYIGIIVTILLSIFYAEIGDIIGNLFVMPLLPGTTMTMSFTYESIRSGTLDLKVFLLLDEANPWMIYQSVRDIGKEQVRVSFTLDGHIQIFPNTSLSIVATKNSKTVSKTVKISPIDYLIYYPHLQGQKYTSFSSIAQIDDRGNVSQIHEEITFNGFHEAVEQQMGLRFPLEKFTIFHNFRALGYALSQRSGELQIDDPFNVFTRLPRMLNTTYKTLPLRYILTNENYHLAFDTPLYVDKQMRMMSLRPETGFQLTNHLYFPTNTFDQVQTLSFRIMLSDIGVNHIDVDYRGSLFSKYRYIGSSSNGIYSVEVDFVDTIDSHLSEVWIHE